MTDQTQQESDEKSRFHRDAEQAGERRTYESLTPKQRSAVDELVDEPENMEEAARDAGVSSSYIHWCERAFGDMVERRKAANKTTLPDGGAERGITVGFTEDEAFRAMRILPAELSQVVYQAVRGHDPTHVDITEPRFEQNRDGDE